MIKENEQAPDFELKDQDGKTVSLSDFAGKPLVLYFYPRDDTPGCTKEACDFRDDYALYEELGAAIVGVSPDDEQSHTKFAMKHELPFTLLADVDHQVSEAYGTWAKKKNFGKEYFGIKRTTFLIDGAGKVAKVFEGVKPDAHSAEVIEALKNLR
jgi:peroxiredoxin Q/BCP